MAAYLRTTMPCLGVPKPVLASVLREARARWPLTDASDYCETVHQLHALPHREEQYAAIDYARRTTRFVAFEHIDLYRTMIVDGAWWDLVDDFAHVLCRLLLQDPTRTGPLLDRWIDDEDLWLRRIAILGQLDAKERTDAARLFRYCERRAHEREFFIRKAIGWALRQYARTAPDVVLAWCLEHRKALSSLSFREATKHLHVPANDENPQKT
jgi:3-methyladenine DNA glycosylase AlkD